MFELDVWASAKVAGNTITTHAAQLRLTRWHLIGPITAHLADLRKGRVFACCHKAVSACVQDSGLHHLVHDLPALHKVRDVQLQGAGLVLMRSEHFITCSCVTHAAEVRCSDMRTSMCLPVLNSSTRCLPSPCARECVCSPNMRSASGVRSSQSAGSLQHERQQRLTGDSVHL
jgi:hypothetical protein